MVKLKETNLDGVKAMARTLLFTDIHPTSLSPIVVQHPFTSSGFNMIMVNGEPKCVDITADSEALHQWRKMVCEQINSAKSAFEIYMMTNKPYTRIEILRQVTMKKIDLIIPKSDNPQVASFS